MEIIEKKIYEEPKKEYTSKGVGGSALGLGIAGTALGLLALNRGGCGWNNGFGLFGGNGYNRGFGLPQNVNINTDTTRSGSDGLHSPSAFMAWEKGCEDTLALQKGLYDWALSQQSQRFSDRQTIDSEMFGLYKSQVDADFGLYKSGRDANDAIIAKHNADAFGLYKNQRDNFDELSARIGALETKQAVADAVEPWRAKVLDMQICGVAQGARAGIELESERRCCADNKIVNYLNSNFYPISVAPVTTGTPAVVRTTSNPLCECCSDGHSRDCRF